jgi:hypothetical protein
VLFAWTLADPSPRFERRMGQAEKDRLARHNEAVQYGERLLTDEEVAVARAAVGLPKIEVMTRAADRYWTSEVAGLHPSGHWLSFHGLYQSSLALKGASGCSATRHRPYMPESGVVGPVGPLRSNDRRIDAPEREGTSAKRPGAGSAGVIGQCHAWPCGRGTHQATPIRHRSNRRMTVMARRRFGAATPPDARRMQQAPGGGQRAIPDGSVASLSRPSARPRAYTSAASGIVSIRLEAGDSWPRQSGQARV